MNKLRSIQYDLIRGLLLVLCLGYLMPNAVAQEKKESDKKKIWEDVDARGYVKDMRTFFIDDLDNVLIDNLLHHRLNLKWYANDAFTVGVEWRNRLFYGEFIKNIPNYGSLIEDVNNDVLDLSWTLVDKRSVVLHTMVDRAYVDYVKGNFEARVGRQRINWGINTIWNPHDLFNTFSYFDFDYEERPGSDAVRLQYYTGIASSVEVAVKAFEDVDDLVAAALWKFNKWNYDFQFLGGVYQDDIATGFGWAGNIKNVGFKGEGAVFIPFKPNIPIDEPVAFNLAVAFDYTHKDWYFSSGGLYNSLGSTDADANSLLTTNLSTKNLSPYKYSLFGLASYQISPLLSSSLSTIYSPSSSNALFINPSMAYSLKDNLTLDGVAQLIFANGTGEKYELTTKLLFVRLKFSY